MLHGIIEALPFSYIVRRLTTPAVYMLKASFKGHVTVYSPHTGKKKIDCSKLMDRNEKVDGGGGGGGGWLRKPLLALDQLKIQGRIHDWHHTHNRWNVV